MYFSSIEIGIGGELEYHMSLVEILKDIGNRNIIWFCNYNRNYRRGGRSIGINAKTHTRMYKCIQTTQTNAYKLHYTNKFKKRTQMHVKLI